MLKSHLPGISKERGGGLVAVFRVLYVAMGTLQCFLYTTLHTLRIHSSVQCGAFPGRFSKKHATQRPPLYLLANVMVVAAAQTLCEAIVSSCSVFCTTVSAGAQSHTAVVSHGFAFQMDCCFNQALHNQFHVSMHHTKAFKHYGIVLQCSTSVLQSVPFSWHCGSSPLP